MTVFSSTEALQQSFHNARRISEKFLHLNDFIKKKLILIFPVTPSAANFHSSDLFNLRI